MKQIVLLGDPVNHSLSPIMHNTALKELGLDKIYRYSVQLTRADELHSKVEAVRKGAFVGANVTIPYKTEIMRFLDDVTEEASEIGSVNTLQRVNGNVIGCNTDCTGFLASLRENSVIPRGLRAVVLGAGGAAKSITYALVKSGIVRLDIWNRSVSRATELVSKILKQRTCETHIWEKRTEISYGEIDLVVNCTPLGMVRQYVDKSPMNSDDLHSDLTVVDLVYNPRRTKLLREAEQAGCKTIDGTSMLVNQGAESFEKWIGKKAPIDVMRTAVLQALGG